MIGETPRPFKVNLKDDFSVLNERSSWNINSLLGENEICNVCDAPGSSGLRALIIPKGPERLTL